MGAAEDSIFAKIATGRIPCQKVFENGHALAFLDINPLAEGHTLVIPKRPAARLSELPADEAAELGRAVQIVARKVTAATGASGYNILLNDGAVAGQEVPYAHVHVIPRREGDGLGYRWKKQQADAARLEALAARIRDAQ